MKIQTKLVSIDYPAAGFIYRAHESLEAIKSLHLVDDPSSCIPSFDTCTGEEISVPASCVVLEPTDRGEPPPGALDQAESAPDARDGERPAPGNTFWIEPAQGTIYEAHLLPCATTRGGPSAKAADRVGSNQ